MVTMRENEMNRFKTRGGMVMPNSVTDAFGTGGNVAIHKWQLAVVE
jgi:hypothetical protein